MLTKSTIKDEFDVKPITSGQMEQWVTECVNIYQGNPPWLDPDDNIDTINFAKSVCSEAARLTTLGIGIHVDGSARAAWLQKELERIYYRLREWVEYGCAHGTVILKPNGDSVELYKNDEFIAEFRGSKEYPHMLHGPITIDDRIGTLLERHEGFDPKTAAGIAECLNAVAKHGFAGLPKKYMVKLGALMLKTRMTYNDGVRLYGKYVAGWGDKSITWRFVAKKGGKAVAEVRKAPVESVSLAVQADTTFLRENGAWDMATLRFRAVDQNGNVLPFCNRVVAIRVEGVLELIGADHIALSGGMAGAYLKTTGIPGSASVTLDCEGMEPVKLDFTVEVRHDPI